MTDKEKVELGAKCKILQAQLAGTVEYIKEIGDIISAIGDSIVDPDGIINENTIESVLKELDLKFNERVNEIRKVHEEVINVANKVAGEDKFQPKGIC